MGKGKIDFIFKVVICSITGVFGWVLNIYFFKISITTAENFIAWVMAITLVVFTTYCYIKFQQISKDTSTQNGVKINKVARKEKTKFLILWFIGLSISINATLAGQFFSLMNDNNSDLKDISIDNSAYNILVFKVNNYNSLTKEYNDNKNELEFKTAYKVRVDSYKERIDFLENRQIEIVNKKQVDYNEIQGIIENIKHLSIKISVDENGIISADIDKNNKTILLQEELTIYKFYSDLLLKGNHDKILQYIFQLLISILIEFMAPISFSEIVTIFNSIPKNNSSKTKSNKEDLRNKKINLVKKYITDFSIALYSSVKETGYLLKREDVISKLRNSINHEIVKNIYALCISRGIIIPSVNGQSIALNNMNIVDFQKKLFKVLINTSKEWLK